MTWKVTAEMTRKLPVKAAAPSQKAGCLLAARKKAERGQVCVMDLDVQFGTDALYLDLDNRVSLLDLLESPERIDVELLRGVMNHHDSGLDRWRRRAT